MNEFPAIIGDYAARIVAACYVFAMYDGEGNGRISCRVRDGLTAYTPLLCITNGNRKALEYITSVVGAGYIHMSNKEKRGLVSNWKPCWRWTLSGQQNVRTLLTAALPHLHVKVAISSLILEFTERQIARDKRPRTPAEVIYEQWAFAQAKKLNERGKAKTFITAEGEL